MSSRYTYYLKHDELPITELRFSATDTFTGLQDENSYYTGDEEHILKAYEKWRNEYAKGDFDYTRYENFRANYVKLMTSNAVELTVARDMGLPDPAPLSLNEYGDFSSEEFDNLQNGQHVPHSSSELLYPDPDPNNEYGYPQTTGSSEYDSVDDKDRIRQIYKEWCIVHDKTYNEARLETFAMNLQVVENYHRDTGKNAELNQYADISRNEYQAMAKNPHLENLSANSQTPSSMLHQYFDETEVERIRQEYLEWCGFNGKEFVEARLDIFATNLLAVESYRAETGQNAVMNAYADLAPEEYNALMSGGIEAPLNDVNSYSSSSTGTSDHAIYNEDESVVYSSNANNKEPLYSDSILVVSPTLTDQSIRDVYQDWCQYYEKPPSEEGLYYFTKNYIVLEKYHRETGEEFTLDERSDLPAEEFAGSEKLENRFEREITHAEEQMDSEEARLQEEAEEERREETARLKKLSNDRIKQARRNEEERKKAEKILIAEERLRLEKERKRMLEEARLQKEIEERTKFEEAKNRVEEAQLLEQKQAAAAAQAALEKRKAEVAIVGIEGDPELLSLDLEKDRLRQERIRLEATLKSDRAKLNEENRREEEARVALEETNRKIEELRKKDKQDASERSDPIILPRAAYMNAVAKTWVDRSAYLVALQEGRAGALPTNPEFAQRASKRQIENDKLLEIEESESVIDSIWNFMKESNTDERGETRNYSKNLIQQADQLIAETTKKSTGVVGEELRYLKKAVDAMRSRNNDDLASDRARTEAKEWEQIQKGLETEAKQAKKRREHDERLAEEARQKARSLKSESRQLKKRADEARRRSISLRDKNRKTVKKIRTLELAVGKDSAGQGNIFSFFTNPLQGRENKDAPKSPTAKIRENKDTPKPPTSKKKENMNNNNIFSFFGGSESDKDRNAPPSTSMTQQVKIIEKQESWLDSLFGFFAGEETEDEIPGQGTITLEPAKKASVFDLFVSPDSIAPTREPGRGSITIDDDSQKSSSIFQFFAKFGISQKKEKKIADPVRLKKVMDYESKLRTRQEKLSRLKAGRSRILKEKDRKLSRKEARKLQRELNALAAGNFTASSTSARVSDIPQLAKWTRTPDGRITGWISEAPTGGRYKMGTKITTSRIKGKVVKPGMTITTVSGSQYRLGLTAARVSNDLASTNSQSYENRTSITPPSPMGSFFGRLFVQETVPSLVEWIQNEDGTITGFVNNKEGFEDGTQITTSPVEKGASKGMLIQTKGGSKYKLWKEKTKNTYDVSSRPKPRF